ncbi:hypothetical protein FHS01_003250 [Longimicrobium terrae]|uniref:Uncharacterized protein n=1 Tax=Longimicrobium terrae TaxID=1639882 RepID=A0A841H0H6_9BACT|nr:hypothetical protein [Longimicrobium terrae]MBB6071513.1 hypothetical protein [Longimicrobium terrae]
MDPTRFRASPGLSAMAGEVCRGRAEASNPHRMRVRTFRGVAADSLAPRSRMEAVRRSDVRRWNQMAAVPHWRRRVSMI